MDQGPKMINNSQQDATKHCKVYLKFAQNGEKSKKRSENLLNFDV